MSNKTVTRQEEIGQNIGYRYDVNLLPDYSRLTPFLKDYMEIMGWQDLNWLEDVHLGFEGDTPAVFDRNINGWLRLPEGMELPNEQQDRDMLAREVLIKFQMSSKHPMVDLRRAYKKFWWRIFALNYQISSHLKIKVDPVSKSPY
jgi:hypothetical protein